MAQDKELIAFAEVVRKMGHTIAVKCLAGKTDEAGELATELCTIAANVKADREMKQEKRAGYDLSALRVDATSASNSETGWERDA